MEKIKKYKLIKTYPNSPKIESIIQSLYSDGLWQCNDNKNYYIKDIEDFKDFWREIKTLFTTEDGIEINEGEVYWFVDEYLRSYVKNANFGGQSPGNKRFSTKEKAEEYILLNKPSLSINEILDYLYKHKEHFAFVISPHREELKKMVKDKNK